MMMMIRGWEGRRTIEGPGDKMVPLESCSATLSWKVSETPRMLFMI
jgi:hypothetical protein